ncbi:hypothetical protein B0A55_00260 [Friedmanniomyces simplex]|uniref:Uncharacterized protein n=1 Tax=Friedmanniomyces simplex TaxID=329884 RepID=A0A4U0Y553_9PEZI|nr:hypothetical protein B0A55_00260 [Friedmanniomyces simplex]
MTALNSQPAIGLTLRRPSLARRQPRRTANVRVGAAPSGSTTWDLDNLQVVKNAAERVRQTHEAWQDKIVSAEGGAQVKTQREFDLLRAERERRDAAQRSKIDERTAKAAEEQRLRAEAQESARQAALATEAARLAEEAERRQVEAELRRTAEEERKESEEAVNLILALEEQERLERIERLELEAAIAAAALADEADERRRRREAEAAAEVLPQSRGLPKKGIRGEGAGKLRPWPKQRE